MTPALDASLLDLLVPLHLVFDPAGRVVRTGPTFERIAPGATGRALSDVVELRHPARRGEAGDLLGQAGRRLELRLPAERNVAEDERPTRMRGVVHPLGDGHGLLVVFFGADVADGVARHELTAADFAQSDLTVEVLFLLEARSAVLAEHARAGQRLRDARREAEVQAATDGLTGLHNRRALDRRLTELSDPDDRHPFGLMQVDLDHFKAINDRHGHAAGDLVLARVGEVLRGEVRQGDMVARIGGDEFMILLEECDDLDLMRRIADRILERLEAPFRFDWGTCRISSSIGITLSRFYERPELDRLIADLDAALYASKHEGRARFSVARPGGEMRVM